ncbi:MAG: TolC family protein, partial [Arenimonas sp.]
MSHIFPDLRHRMSRVFFAAVFTSIPLSLFSTSTMSAAVIDMPHDLSLPQLIELARRDNKDLQTARYAIAISHARLQQAGLRSNPRLGLSGASDVVFGNEGEYAAAIRISQDFPIAGRLLRQKELARVDIALAEAEVAEAERRLAGEVASNAYHLILLDRQIASR